MVGDGTTIPAGKVMLFAVSATVSGNGDVGADPNKIYYVTDDLANTDPTVAAQEMFYTYRYGAAREVLRGIAFTPGTSNITSY